MSRKRKKRKKQKISSGDRRFTKKDVPFHYVNLGNAFLDQGKLDEAISCYQKAVELKPDLVGAYYNMGNAFLDQGKLDEAISCYQKAVELKPELPEPYNNMGIALQDQGKWDEAIACYEKALEIKSDFPEAYNNMGITLQDQGKLDEAIYYFQKALELRPDFAEAYNNMGTTFRNQGKLDEAIFYYEKALQLKPDPGFEVRKTFALPVICASKEIIEQSRKNIIEQMKSLKNKGLILQDPNKQVRCVTSSLAYHGLNDKEIQKEIASFFIHICSDLDWVPSDYKKQQRRYDKIKIGIISTFLYDHTIGRLNHGIIKKLSRGKFHVELFRFPGREDRLSEAINSAADEVVILPTKLALVRQEIAEHSLDILFYLDIGMESLTYFLAFSRLAPVQCVTWGHPVTTGIPNVDYFISSESAEPPGAEGHYSERLILLKRLGVYYYRPELPQMLPSRDNFDLPRDHNLYVCPQTLFKFHPDFDDVLGAILRRDPHGLLILIEGEHEHWAKLLHDRFTRTFPDAVDRVRFLPRMSREDFLSLLMVADVLLDTIHFGGGNTSLEAFAFGVPIVTLPGRFLRGRLTLALYKQTGVMDCVANDTDSYVNIAVKLANDKAWRDEIKGKIRAGADVLYEDIEAVRELEGFFEWAVEAEGGRTFRS